MPSAVWTGSISFGLVNVPVRLTPAVRSRDVSFNQLEQGTGARIRYRKVSEQSGEEVPADRIVRGFEIEKGRYVVVDKEELDALAPKSTRTIEIEDFVDLDDIDPLYFETPYYVLPEEKAAKPYRLLVEAMTELNKVAIGRVVIRSKERLVAIRPLEGMLCIETMRYADEVLPRTGLAGLPGEGVEVGERELAMARQLVEALSGEFEPEKYHDEYREELLALIDKKAAGEEIVAQPEVEAPAKVLDLMAALQASLARTGREGGEEAPEEASGEASGGTGRGGGGRSTRARGSAKGGAKAAPKKAAAKKVSRKRSA